MTKYTSSKASVYPYPLLVWLTTIIMPPVIYYLFDYIQKKLGYEHTFNFNDPILLLLVIFFGAIYSLPALVFFWLINLKVNKLKISIHLKKILLAFAGLVLILGSFFLILGMGTFNISMGSLYLYGPYIIIFTVSVFFYRLQA
jgi:hypothetical protein